MLRCVSRLILFGVSVAIFASAAVAECAAPAQSGLALCFPSAGSTVLYPATIELAANSGGAPITHVSVYDGNVRRDSFGFLPGSVIDLAIGNGFHRITVNAWDANGKLYQARSNFTVTGFGAGPCARGAGTIAMCTPSQGGFQPESSVNISAAFAPGVKSWGVTLDGHDVGNSTEEGLPASGAFETFTFAAAGKHTLVATAVDAQGLKSTLTRHFSTFHDGACAPRSGLCNPGISVTEPSMFSADSAVDTGTSFVVKAEVTGNPKPTTKMIVYLDGVKLQESAGPGITEEVKTTKGSHFMVILAWDTTGRMYETYGNVDVQ